MPTAKTECTELAVAFGLLGLCPETAKYEEAARRFAGTLGEATFERFRRLMDSDKAIGELARPLWDLGRSIRSSHPAMFPDGAHALWYGPLQQSRSVTAPQDLIVSATAVSVKANSFVVFNLSPYNLFISIPRGRVAATNSENWFLYTAEAEYCELFSLCPETRYRDARAFARSADRFERKRLQESIRALDEAQEAQFTRKYVAMCRKAAGVSEWLFNRNLRETLGTVHASALKDELLRFFLRMDGMRYVLMGLERGAPFAVVVPAVSDWKRRYELVDLRAAADMAAGQSKVAFDMALRPRGGGGLIRLPFHAEIRWSHGKFCGNPEAKLYRDFDWQDVPGFSPIA